MDIVFKSNDWEKSLVGDLLITLTEQVSHHDPATGDGSNILTFNRRKQMVHQDQSELTIEQSDIDALCAVHSAPGDIAEMLAEFSFVEFSAIALIRLLIDIYGRGDGAGLFSGVTRYSMLETRLRAAAVRSHSIGAFWSRMAHDLQLPIHPTEFDAKIGAFCRFSSGIQRAILNLMAHEYRAVMMLARAWHNAQKPMKDNPFEMDIFDQNKDVVDDGPVILHFDAAKISDQATAESSVVIEVPAVSTNSLRHEIVRAPGWTHIFASLGIHPDTKIPPGIEAMFINGGSIRAGAKEPQNAASLAKAIRDNFPLLDLLGATTDSFYTGDSRLSMSSWLVCRENREALLGTPAADLSAAQISAFEMIDDVTHTRQATEAGLGQMIWNFETLAAGSQILVRFSLNPFTRNLTRGALAAAVETWLANDPSIAGQSARGYGHCAGQWLRQMPNRDEHRGIYEEFVSGNRDKIIDWLTSGTLGTGTVVVA